MINKQTTEAPDLADHAGPTGSRYEATQVSLDLALPSAPTEADACVRRLITGLAQQSGIHLAHVIERSAYGPARLCVHYDAASVKVEWVRELVRAVGAQLTSRYGHLVVHMQSDLHGQALRAVEEKLSATVGVVEAAATADRVLRIEFDSNLLAESDLREIVADIERQIQLSRARGIPQLRAASARWAALAGPVERSDEPSLLDQQSGQSPKRFESQKAAARLLSDIQWSRWIRTLLFVFIVALGVVLLDGCARSSAAEASTRAELPAEFTKALRRCQRKEPGEMNRRARTPATQSHLRECLASSGWLPNGQRSFGAQEAANGN